LGVGDANQKMTRKKHRSRFEITSEILEHCKNFPKRQQWIVQHCNVNGRLFQPIAQELIASKLLERVQLRKHRITKKWRCTGYLTTDAGKEWLMKYYALIGVFNVAEAKIK
jgi:predicted transcriptional regulator